MLAYQAYNSPLEAFGKGDYCYTAKHAGANRVLKGAALIMIGNTKEGLSSLEDADTPEASYYRAFGLWGNGQIKEALEEIDRCIVKSKQGDTLFDKARKLQSLISQQRIRVLVQANNSPAPRHWQMVREMKKSTQFEVISIGFHAGDDIRIELYETLESVLCKLPRGWTPDFYLCHQVEYNMMPIGIERASFPIIGFTGDHDLHIHTCYHHLKLLDAIIVASSTDHYEVSKTIGVDLFTFCKVFGVDADTFDTPVDKKDIDIFFSGMVFHPYHDDKARIVNRLMQFSNKYNVCVFDYRLSDAEYAKYLAESKITLTYVRRYGQIPSRGLEALRRGTAVLSQDGGEIELFFNEEDGVIPYRTDNLEQVAERVLTQWDKKYKSAALRGMEKVIDAFSLRVCVDRYLKFLTLISSGINISARKGDNHIASQLRYPSLLGSGGPVVFTTNLSYVITKSYKMTCKQLENSLKAHNDAYSNNILGQCYTLNYFYNKKYLHIDKKELLAAAMKTLEDGQAKFANNIAILFNYARLCYHIGYSDIAKRVFQNIVSLNTYQYDALDSFYPYDFFPEFFSYRSLIDEVMNYLIKREDSSKAKLLSIVLSNAWYYLGIIAYEAGDYKEASDRAEKALSLLENIPFYYLLAAKALSYRGEEIGRTQYLEKAAKYLKTAFDISPSIMHPNMNLFISLYQELGKGEDSPEVLPYIERWKRCSNAYVVKKIRLSFWQKCLHPIFTPFIRWYKATVCTRVFLASTLGEKIRQRLKKWLPNLF